MRWSLLLIVGAGLLRSTPLANAQSAPERVAPPQSMPIPAVVQSNEERLRFNGEFTVAIPKYTDARLQRAITRALGRLETLSGLPFKTAAAPQSGADSKGGPALIVEVQAAGDTVQSVQENESYTLDVSAQQSVLKAATVVGALRGLATLLQLAETDAQGLFLRGGHIEDHPRFPWRGLLIDVCRHFEPVEVIKRNLDAMSVVKLNVFHWHLSEDQGFRVESKKFPKLHELGSDGDFYTQQQVREIVEYARDRGIRVVPEFDMPGHATAWFVAYPQYASGPGPYQIERSFGIFNPAFDPTREEVYKFLDRFIGEMAPLFPDAYWHVGGDESNGKQWDANPRIAEFKKRHGLKDNAALQAYFNQRLLKILQKHGKKMIGWDEILHPDLPKDVVVQSWRGQQSLVAAAKQGYRGVLSAGYYLDHMKSAAEHYWVDPLPPGNALDQAPVAGVLGGEACLWGEFVTPETIDSRLWPRAAAVAERLWSQPEIRDVDDMYRRLDTVSLQLESAGAMHLSGPDRILRQLAGSEQIGPVREIMRLSEPLDFGQRARLHQTQMTPMSGLLDAATPDSAAARRVSAMVAMLFKEPAKRDAMVESLRGEFRKWREFPSQVSGMVSQRPRLRDVEGIAAQLGELGALGEETLGYAAKGERVQKSWTDEKLALLQEVAKPRGTLKVAVIPAMRALVSGVSGGLNQERSVSGH
ncbi:MAG TPA: family 20 glycosylhydrolase [Candidatus Dormibacteraeota bacterium]|nr:family 20 glycosylhydrolase [Candidatus Dormibacteraeota bacterium]